MSAPEIERLRERVNELELWRDEIAERLGTLEESMRGLDSWLADQPRVITVAEVADAVVVALGGSARRDAQTWPGDQ